MLKTISSITNAIGALNYKGTWNASTNTPTLASGVGTKGDYYVVSVAGSTNLDGETLWGVGDWAVFNGAVWQKVEGGNTINATTVTASTSVTTPIIQALNSAGGTLKNNSGIAQLQWGSGGGSNLSLEVATNINPANAAVAISPTGTGTVTINPATASTMNNVAIGGTTPLAGKFTTLEATGVTTLQAGSVSDPAITTTGDTNTGIFFPAADTIAFTEGGAESMRIHSSGGVSIGNTVDPSATNLSVTGTTTSAIFISSSGTTGTIANAGSASLITNAVNLGHYLVSANCVGNSTVFCCYHIYFDGGGSGTATAIKSNALVISSSGANIITVTNNSGGSDSVQFTTTRLK